MAAMWCVDPCDRSGGTLRFWDGAAWTDRTAPDPGVAAPDAPWTRHPLGFLRHRWFHILMAALLAGAAGAGLYFVTKSVVATVLGAAISAAGAATAFAAFIDGRLRFRERVTTRTLILVCILGGAVGTAIAQLERLLPHSPASIAAVGPIEEVAKLAVPLALWLWGSKRFRDPRVGLAIVVASAAGFAIGEVAVYAFRAADGAMSAAGHLPTPVAVASTAVFKPLTDPFLHMCLSGIVGAVAWREWHLAERFRVTWPVVAALLVAMVLHSMNDMIAALVPLASVIMPILVYLVFKHSARSLVPPEVISRVPPRWRPAHLRSVPEATHPVQEAAAAGG